MQTSNIVPGRTEHPTGMADPAFAVPHIRRADDVAGFGRARGWRGYLMLPLACLAIIACVAFSAAALLTFGTLFGTFAELRGGVAPMIWPIPLYGGWAGGATLALSFLTACSLAFLLMDRIAEVGLPRARRVLLEKAGHILPSPLPHDPFFVRVTQGAAHPRLDPPEDVGWLFVGPDRLEYVGDRLRITLPRGSVLRVARRGRALDLSIRDAGEQGDGVLRFHPPAARNGSRTDGALAEALEVWLG